ncbi:hypothetical protein [Brachybacterium sp.]|uniref:hypothetical protein n=1 Tax=Brachybacterium sp. TaxID=1891286 RepID=UPI002ED4DCA1
MTSTPMYHPDDDETNPHPEDQGIAPSSAEASDRTDGDETRSSREADSSTTDLGELNDEGVGGTVGAEDTFEPEESEGPGGSGAGDSTQA